MTRMNIDTTGKKTIFIELKHYNEKVEIHFQKDIEKFPVLTCSWGDCFPEKPAHIITSIFETINDFFPTITFLRNPVEVFIKDNKEFEIGGNLIYEYEPYISFINENNLDDLFLENISNLNKFFSIMKVSYEKNKDYSNIIKNILEDKIQCEKYSSIKTEKLVSFLKQIKSRIGNALAMEFNIIDFNRYNKIINFSLPRYDEHGFYFMLSNSFFSITEEKELDYIRNLTDVRNFFKEKEGRDIIKKWENWTFSSKNMFGKENILKTSEIFFKITLKMLKKEEHYSECQNIVKDILENENI